MDILLFYSVIYTYANHIRIYKAKRRVDAHRFNRQCAATLSIGVIGAGRQTWNISVVFMFVLV